MSEADKAARELAVAKALFEAGNSGWNWESTLSRFSKDMAESFERRRRRKARHWLAAYDAASKFPPVRDRD